MTLIPIQRMRDLIRRGSTLLASLSLAICLPMPAHGLEVSVFSSDATPPMGHPLSGGWIAPVSGNDSPELLKGLILRDAGGTYVICALDWCTLHSKGHFLFRDALAKAAQTAPERVSLHCVHQHNSPILDLRAQEILETTPEPPKHVDRAWFSSVIETGAAAVRGSMGQFQAVSEIGTSQAEVDRVASTRRVKAADGSIRVRYSSTPDADLRAAPEGLIDPWLKTLTLFGPERPIVQLHYYATHPQSYYGDGRTTWDVPGIARERLEKETGAFQIYITGCAGDITMGKYNDGAHERRQELADRMYDAMRRSIAGIARHPVAPIRWGASNVQFETRPDLAANEEATRRIVTDPAASATRRLQGAMTLSFLERQREGTPFVITGMALGPIRLLNLPGEPFVEFQLFTQRLFPGEFVLVGGYTDGGTDYICTEASFSEGGYEPDASNLAPPSEGKLKQAIEKLMLPLGDPPAKEARE